MPETPVTTIARLGAARGPVVFAATLPNGKPVLAHLPRSLAHLAPGLSPGCEVRVELSPYDFDHARIAGIAGGLAAGREEPEAPGKKRGGPIDIPGENPKTH